MEIERKFLVEALPENLEDCPSKDIIQAYISTSPVIRIRKSGERHILTVKSKGLLMREEFEMALSQEEFESLLRKTEGHVIRKTRYLIPEKEGLTIELDIFHDLFQGLILAEVEFSSPEAAETYVPAAFLKKEVTEDPRYQNASMTKMSAREIAELTAPLPDA